MLVDPLPNWCAVQVPHNVARQLSSPNWSAMARTNQWPCISSSSTIIVIAWNMLAIYGANHEFVLCLDIFTLDNIFIFDV